MNEKEFMQTIASIADASGKKQNASAFRLYKAVVTVSPDAQTHIGEIRFAGETTRIQVPFVNNTVSSAVGDVVWVATVFDSLRNAVAWAKQDLSIM